jgi:hypothetical protein
MEIEIVLEIEGSVVDNLLESNLATTAAYGFEALLSAVHCGEWRKAELIRPTLHGSIECAAFELLEPER